MPTIRDNEVTISGALRQAAAAFSVQSDSAQLDSGVLLGHILGRSRSWVLAHSEIRLSLSQQSALTRALIKAAAGVPLPYLTGHQEFYGLDFLVDQNTLIPRPETELLVELALNWLKENTGRRMAGDIGTGSGCIAIALAAHIPDLKVYAVDNSAGALRMAGRNIRRHKLGKRIRLIQGDLMTTLPDPLDIVCANLPYIPTQVLSLLPVARHEPRQALDGGVDGMDFIRRLLAQSPACISPGGMLLIEIEAGQGPRVVALAQEHYPAAEVYCHSDLAGKDRVVTIRLPGKSDTMPVRLP